MIVGHQRQIRYLERVLEKGTFAHAYLFSGPEAVGKRAVALAAARSLLCTRQPKTLDGCGTCEDCQLAANALHPDLVVLSFEQPLVEGKNEREIGIGNIHELKRRMALTAWRGGRKVVIVDQADSLSRDAQSALLKILEEPDEKTVFFLITRSPAALLATVRSRSVPMGFTTLGDAELTPLAAAVPEPQSREFVALAGGRPGILVRLIGDESFRKEYRARAERFSRLRAMDLAGAFAFAEEHARDADTMSLAFVHLLRAVRDDLHAAISNAGAVPAESRDGRMARLAAFLATLLERLRIFETTTVNRRLLADSIFFEFSPLGTPNP